MTAPESGSDSQSRQAASGRTEQAELGIGLGIGLCPEARAGLSLEGASGAGLTADSQWVGVACRKLSVFSL